MLDTNVVVSEEPFHVIVDERMKLVPVAVSVNPAPPALAEDGLIEVSDGIGFG